MAHVGFESPYNTYGKKGHKTVDYRANNPNENKTKPPGGTKPTCSLCGLEGHTKATCYRKPGNPEYEKFLTWKPKGVGNKEASNVEIFLTSVEDFIEVFVEPFEPVELCLVNNERYV